MRDTDRRSRLATALRATAARLRGGARYEWGHVGRCNCGHLVQTLAGLDDVAVFRAFRHELTEWSELANDYCAATGSDVEDLFQVLLQAGLTLRDVQHLEHLSDPRVLERFPLARRRALRRNVREDAADYMDAMADCAEPAGNSSVSASCHLAGSPS